MKIYEIHLGDRQRILFGQSPPIFLLEVFVRTLIIYVFLLLTLRWLGKRMNGQLTILEMAIMLTLGAIVSVAMQVPDRGILLSMFVLLCTLTFQRTLTWLGIRSAKIEELTQGRISTLLKNGVMEVEEMQRCRISRQQLYAELRSKGIFNMGEVRRIYLESPGVFTTIKMHAPIPGLPTFPPGDQPVLDLLKKTNDMVCRNCGQTLPQTQSSQTCPHCGANDWTQAVISRS